MLRIEAPAGSFGGKFGIWELLDEAPAPASETVMLRENGFRYAIGSAAARTLAKARLESLPGLRVARDRALPGDDRPVEIEVTDAPRDLAAFFFDAAGRMRGLSFDAARPYFQVRFKVASLPGRRIQLRVTPELREPPGPLQYVKTPTGYRRDPEYRGRVFETLALTIGLADGEFLVVGPAPEVRSMPLLGTPFFVAGEADAARENLYVFIPQLDESTSWWSIETAAVAAGRPRARTP